MNQNEIKTQEIEEESKIKIEKIHSLKEKHIKNLKMSNLKIELKNEELKSNFRDIPEFKTIQPQNIFSNLNSELKNTLDQNLNFNKSLIKLQMNEKPENKEIKLKLINLEPNIEFLKLKSNKVNKKIQSQNLNFKFKNAFDENLNFNKSLKINKEIQNTRIKKSESINSNLHIKFTKFKANNVNSKIQLQNNLNLSKTIHEQKQLNYYFENLEFQSWSLSDEQIFSKIMNLPIMKNENIILNVPNSKIEITNFISDYNLTIYAEEIKIKGIKTIFLLLLLLFWLLLPIQQNLSKKNNRRAVVRQCWL